MMANPAMQAHEQLPFALGMHVREGRVPNAPSLFYCAAVVEGASGPVSATGVDACPSMARLRCRNELAERRTLLALAAAGGGVVLGPDDEDGPGLDLPAASLIGRAARSARRWIGAAAGSDAAGVVDRARAEMVERWRVHQWRSGVEAPRSPSRAAAQHVDMISSAWRSSQPAWTGLLELGDPEDLPVFAAWSADRDGRRLCFGFGCAEDEVAAAEAALRELVQMEFGLRIAELRAFRGTSPVRGERRRLAFASRPWRCRAARLFETRARVAERSSPPMTRWRTAFPAVTGDGMVAVVVGVHSCRADFAGPDRSDGLTLPCPF